jgi:hypothetical protein
MERPAVIPTKAGIQRNKRFIDWIPAFAGMTVVLLAACSSGGGSDDDVNPGAGSGTGTAPSTVASPTVTGPVTGGLRGHALWDSWYDLAELGYVEEEYFISGTARTYPETTPADYTTRIIVRRPADAAAFNGTVLLDWVNVTAQFENAVDSIESHDFFHRAGFAYVHVSAQAAGLCCVPLLTPQAWDPLRYAGISHPGDDYSFDMFSQIARAMKAPLGADPMGGLPVTTVLAMGQSQSGTRLHDYIAQVQDEARVIDGFLVHADGGANKQYPADPSVPVIQLMSEREATPEEPNVARNYRLWEVAGAAHQDFWIGYHQVFGASLRAELGVRRPASADTELHQIAGNYGEQIHPLSFVCVVAGTQFPLRYVVSSAIHHLDRWAKTGVAPPVAARYEFDGSGQLARDQHGNARGGIRLPPIEVPVARYDSALCDLGGITIPFTELQLQMLYPTHADYACLMREATLRSIGEGFLLREDAEDLMTRVEAASNRWLNAGTRNCPLGL